MGLNNFVTRCRYAFLILLILVIYGETTRFLPMIIWDYNNPQLSCRCNWLNVPKIDKYDRFSFICPTSTISVALLDGYTRPTSDMNLNIYHRKWEGGSVTKLKQQLSDGSFCNVSKSEKLHTCNNGASSSLSLNIKPLKYQDDQTHVFFSNAKDGSVASLSDTRAHCGMVFVINITNSLNIEYDLTYDKCSKADASVCNNIEQSCFNGINCQKPPTTQPPLVTTTTTTQNSTTQLPTSTNAWSQTVISETTSTVNGSSTPIAEEQRSPCNSNDMRYIIGLGVCGAIIFFLMVLLLSMLYKKSKKETCPENGAQQANRPSNINIAGGGNMNAGYVNTPVTPGVEPTFPIQEVQFSPSKPVSNGANNQGFRASSVQPDSQLNQHL